MAQLTTMARPYAKAAFQAAFAADALNSWSEMLNKVAAVVTDERVKALLSRPSAGGKAQADLIIEVMGDEISEKVQNFIHVLAKNKRLVLLPEVVVLFEQLKAKQEKRVDVEVVSAFELNESTREKLIAALKKRLQQEVSLNTSVDKRLIGGMVIHAGDMVIDGSVRGRLNKLAENINA